MYKKSTFVMLALINLQIFAPGAHNRRRKEQGQATARTTSETDSATTHSDEPSHYLPSQHTIHRILLKRSSLRDITALSIASQLTGKTLTIKEIAAIMSNTTQATDPIEQRDTIYNRNLQTAHTLIVHLEYQRKKDAKKAAAK